jgi:hypothetical protein
VYGWSALLPGHTVHHTMSSMGAQFPPRLGKITMLDTPNSVLELEIYENPGKLETAQPRKQQAAETGAVAWCTAKDQSSAATASGSSVGRQPACI